MEWLAGLELREQLVAVLEGVCRGEADEVAAGALLSELRSVWVRERRWRNTAPPAAAVVHRAGPVIACREARPSCPGYIVDRRQSCELCGRELIRGRWAMFFDPGEQVAVYGTITYPAARRHEARVPCSGQPL